MRYEIILWFMWILKKIPGKVGCAVRRTLLPGQVAKSAMIWDNVQVDFPATLRIGERSSVNRGSVLNCGGGIEIGTDVLIGPNVVIYSQNHAFADRNTLISKQGYSRDKVVICDDVWVAANAVILPGVTLAAGCVIGAGTIVTKSTEPYGVYVGSPAQKIGKRGA